MTYDCLLEREAWLGGGGRHTMGGGGGACDAALYIYLSLSPSLALSLFQKLKDRISPYEYVYG